MTSDEFANSFFDLTQAFSVQKAREKGEVYFKKLEKLSHTTFLKTCDYAVMNLDKFPSIAKLIEISRMYPDESRAFECKKCDSGGFQRLWRFSFRCDCSNGDRLSKLIPKYPHEHEKKGLYGRLNKEHFELYGKDLVEGDPYKGEKEPEIITKAREIFGV